MWWRRGDCGGSGGCEQHAFVEEGEVPDRRVSGAEEVDCTGGRVGVLDCYAGGCGEGVSREALRNGEGGNER